MSHEARMPYSPIVAKLARLATRTHVSLYRLTGGAMDRRAQNMPVLLLTTTGRKSGKHHTTPVVYLEDGNGFVVVASNGGQGRLPNWWLNMRKSKQAHIEIGRKQLRVRIQEANPEEHQRHWPRVVAGYSGSEWLLNLKGAKPMYMHYGKSGEASSKATQGHVIDLGWRYDLMLWWHNILSRGKWQELQHIITDLAQFQPGEMVLDVGCGTGTLTIIAKQRVDAVGRVSGIDPGLKQITRARSKAGRAGLSIDFQVGVIEQLAFPDQTFDVVLSTFMMHTMPDDLKRQGLAETARVLKPGGRLLVVDFRRPEKHENQSERPVHTGPWQSGVQDQPTLMKEAGFSQIESGEIETGTTKLPEVGFARARKS